jgi:hypothetical protein
MEKSISDKEKSRMNVDAKNRIRVFDGKKTANKSAVMSPAHVEVGRSINSAVVNDDTCRWSPGKETINPPKSTLSTT